jgi:hypothetical protein
LEPIQSQSVSSAQTQTVRQIGRKSCLSLGMTLMAIWATPSPAFADSSVELPALAPEGAEATQASSTPPSPSVEAILVEPSPSVSQSRMSVRVERVPRYQRHQPQFAISIAGALQALDNQNLTRASDSKAQVRGFSAQWEFQPRALQSAGVFGFGPSFGFYPSLPKQGGRGGRSSWALGGQLRYQARFFREQILVPMVGYQAESLAYRGALGEADRLWLRGPFVGAMFLLNVLDRETAASFYDNVGVSRSYLVAELRQLAGADERISINERSLFFGLRIEY